MSKIPTIIYESDEVVQYLAKRNLTKQYQKAKQYLLAGQVSTIQFGLKQPKPSGVWYFRINNQFRAIGGFDGSVLRIVEIDNHS